MKTSTILCMFSGGIDSSGVLHKLFTDAAYQDRALIVHHIVLQNRENRAQVEMDSVKKILGYYANAFSNRPFTYTQSLFNTSGFAALKSQRFPFDMDVCAFTAANIAVARKDIRYVAMGRTKTDVEAVSGDFMKRMQRAQEIFKAVYSLENEAEPEYIFPVVNMTKKEIWASLPKPIQRSSWYCRHPIYQSEGKVLTCNKCRTCKEVAEFLSHD